jgi:hypothetical protein
MKATTHILFLTAIAGLALAAGSAPGAIVAVNDGNFGGSAPPASGIVTQSIAVGAGADMLIVMTASELGTGGPTTVSYGGVAMNLAVGNIAHSSIWYLDLSTPGISGTNVVVDMSAWGVRNGHASGWVSIDGNLGAGESIALHSTASRAEAPPVVDNSIDLVTTVETFNVVNFNGNHTSGTVAVNSPNPTVIYTDNNIGSARSAAAYDDQVAAGTSTYQWTLTGGTLPDDYRRIDAAAFEVIPEPSTLALAALGLAGLIRRRRRKSANPR